MKKAFTLIELLIVMVIVGILVTVALPKYRAAMERGRAAEGIANLKAASDWLNAKYILNDNVYPSESAVYILETFGSSSVSVVGAVTRRVYFTTPEFVSCGGGYTCLQAQRKQGNTVFYTLTAYNKDGELQKVTCTGSQKALCEPLGMTLSGSEYVIDLTDE